MLADGGFCHWHLRRRGQLTIREIPIATRHWRRKRNAERTQADAWRNVSVCEMPS